MYRYGTSPSANAPPAWTQPRAAGELVSGVHEHEQHDDRHDRDRETVVRDAQAADQRSDEQIPRTPGRAPDERAMEQQRDEQQVKRVHLGERGFLPERPGERQREPGGSRDDGADPEPDHDQDGHPDDRCRGRRRQEVHPPCDRAGRDEREQLAQQHEQGVSGRVHDPEPVRVQLGVRPVAEADAGRSVRT